MKRISQQSSTFSFHLSLGFFPFLHLTSITTHLRLLREIPNQIQSIKFMAQNEIGSLFDVSLATFRIGGVSLVIIHCMLYSQRNLQWNLSLVRRF